MSWDVGFGGGRVGRGSGANHLRSGDACAGRRGRRDWIACSRARCRMACYTLFARLRWCVAGWVRGQGWVGSHKKVHSVRGLIIFGLGHSVPIRRPISNHVHMLSRSEDQSVIPNLFRAPSDRETTGRAPSCVPIRRHVVMNVVAAWPGPASASTSSCPVAESLIDGSGVGKGSAAVPAPG